MSSRLPSVSQARISLVTWSWLALWMAIATLLRFWQLDQLPPWTDELATMVFGLGNSFLGVPLDQFIDGDTLLEPLRVRAGTGFGDVTQHLLHESTHPPFYFWLAQGWMKAGAVAGELLPVGVARSLPALLGVLSVPSAFGLSWIMVRSPMAANLAAMLMALSPLNLFWAREARHYTLVLLLVMASLACFLRAAQSLQKPSFQKPSFQNHSSQNQARSPLPWSLVVAWSMTNILGVATHYFFVLSTLAQGLVFIKIAWMQWPHLNRHGWQRLVPVALATAVGTLVWLPSIAAIRSNPASQWIASETGLNRWLMPPLRLLMWSITFLTQLPSAITLGLPLPLIIASMVMMVSFVMGLGVYLWGLRDGTGGVRQGLPRTGADTGVNINSNSSAQLRLKPMQDYIGFSLLLFLAVTYFAGQDLSQAPRFTFVFYGAVMVYLGALLERGWRLSARARQGVGAIAIVSLLGAITVLSNTGYLQHHRPDVMATVIQPRAAQTRLPQQKPTLIVTTHQHHGQTGRMMGIELVLRDRESALNPRYFLAHRNPQTKTYDGAIAQLTQQLEQMPRPFDLWLLNFRANFDPSEVLHCPLDQDHRGNLGEYRYKLYRCH